MLDYLTQYLTINYFKPNILINCMIPTFLPTYTQSPNTNKEADAIGKINTNKSLSRTPKRKYLNPSHNGDLWVCFPIATILHHATEY